MLFSYNWLKSFFKNKLPEPKKLAELLTLHSFPVKELKKKGKDFVLDIDVFTNRVSDCASHIGIAREIGAIINSKLKIQIPKLREEKGLKAKDFVNLEVEDKNACLRYTARVISNVKVGNSPKWMQEFLIACGLNPINNVVDITNYVMLETGQPLHAFDLEKLEGKKIFVRFAKKGEKIFALDEKEYNLDDDILVIADAKGPIAIAGIKGGANSAIEKKTKMVVLESANFDRRVVRSGSKKLGLKTDASLRFEHGIDPNLTEFAINRAAFLIQKIAGGKVAQGLIDFYPKKVFPRIIKLNFDYLERLLGTKISKKEVLKILKRLGFKIKNLKLKTVDVEVPTFRLDVSIPEDLIEEIARIYGYQKIPSIFPLASLVPPKKNFERFWEDFSKDVLKEAGFFEVYNYSFLSEDLARIFKYSKNDLIEVENPISSNQKYLRPSLIPNLLNNVKENSKNFPGIKIFEIGKVFKKEILEKKALAGLIFKKEKNVDSFYELKGVCDLLFEKMGISNFWYDSFEPTPEESKISIWHLGRSAEIKVRDKEIGFLGEIDSRILEELKIEGQVFVFDLDFEKLQKLATEEREFEPISKYPAAIRDISVLVPAYTRVEDVLNEIERIDPLISDVDIFDIYEGEGIPEGKKSLAFRIIFLAKDRPISPEEIDKVQAKIIKNLEKNPNWEVRK